MPGNNEYFQAFCNISRVLGTALNQDEILALIIRTAQGLIKGKAISIFLMDEETDELVPIAQEGLSPEYLRQFSRPAKLLPILKKEGYLYIRDATTDPRLDDREIKRAEGIASILVVPIMIRGQLIGGLSLYTDTLRDFSEEEIGFLAAIAAQGGAAIEHSRLLERLRENTRLFNDLSANINASLDLPKIFHILSADLARTMKVKASSVLLVDEEQGTLERVASYGLSEKYLHQGPLSVERSVSETMEGKPVVIKDAAADKRVQHRKQKLEEGIVSILSAPIKTKEKVIGVLRLYSGIPREFTKGEIMLVTALANQGGLAIQNASMYQLLQEDMKDLQKDIWSHRLWF